MKTVLHIITGLGSGGAERMLTRVLLADQGRGRRHIVVVLMDEGLYGERLRAKGVELHCLNMRRGVPSLAALINLVRIMRNSEPDAVMTWLYHATLMGTLAAPFAKLSTRRVIWNLRGADIDFTQTSRMTSRVVRGLALLSRFPAAVAVNSMAGMNYHRALGYRPKRWVYLPNGFDLDEWRPDADDRRAVRTEWKFGDEIIAIGMVARVDPQKDYPTLLAAAEQLTARDKRIRFVLIGKDTERLTIPRTLQGYVMTLGERRDIQRLLRGLDIGVLSSAFGEGFPNFVGEAMASGVPCVVTDVGDATALVGDTGLSVPPRLSEALATTLAILADEHADMRHERGLAARARIRDFYDLASITAQYETLWDSVAQTA